MRDFGISDLHGDCGQAAADVSRPLMPAHCGEGLRDGLRRLFPPSRQPMRGFVEIVDDDGAGLEGHKGKPLYSLFVRLMWSAILLCLAVRGASMWTVFHPLAL
jgi:hypothetical protein